MRFPQLRAPFKFAPVQLTVITVLVYAAVFISVLVYDEPARIARDTEGLDVDRAYDALSKVCRTSHALHTT